MSNRTLHILNAQLEQIHRHTKSHYDSFLYYKRLLMVTNLVIHISNAVSMTSLAIYFAGTSAVLVFCAVSSSLSTILSIGLTTSGVEDKVHSHQITYLQLQDLTSTYVPAVAHQWRDSVIIQRLLESLNYKTSIIMNTSNPTRTPLIMVSHPLPLQQPSVAL
jgi:hypothetical protein